MVICKFCCFLNKPHNCRNSSLTCEFNWFHVKICLWYWSWHYL